MPVVAVRGTEYRTVGTCFAIANQGLVLTARHVIEEGLRPTNAPHEEGQWSLGVLYVAEPISADDVDDPSNLLGGFISATKMYVNNDLDIGVIHLNLPVNVKTGASLNMPAHVIGTAIPSVGSYCFGFGYHSVSWTEVDEGKVNHALAQTYSASRGKVVEVHFPRRDSSSLRWPCFRTTARFDKGMSGGPVIGSEGNVIGVVCSSFETDGEYISYVSIAALSLLLRLESATASGVQNKFLYDFVVGGAVKISKTDGFKVQRDENSVAINYGLNPTFRNFL